MAADMDAKMDTEVAADMDADMPTYLNSDVDNMRLPTWTAHGCWRGRWCVEQQWCGSSKKKPSKIHDNVYHIIEK
jgi:hypothetical protein